MTSSRKVFPLFAFVFAIGCGSVDTMTPVSRDEATASRSFRVLKEGDFRSQASDETAASTASISVARNELAFRALWNEFAANEPLPMVDFAVESVAVLSLGRRNSGGYSVEPQDASMHDGVLRITAPVKTPGRGSIVTMAITSPYAIVAVRARDFNSAEWVGSDGSPVAREETARNRM